jgi:ArsR family transcriptional regulator
MTKMGFDHENPHALKFVHLRITMTKSNFFSTDQEQLARFAKAMAHPVRITILQWLSNQTCCYHGDMADELPIAKSTLSQHLNELKDAGLIQGNITPPTVKYCIHKENWMKAQDLFARMFNEVALKEVCQK